MKTLCAFDNVACIVDNLAMSLDTAFLPFAVIGFALVAAYAIAGLITK